MSVARLGPDSVAALAVALGDPATLGRMRPRWCAPRECVSVVDRCSVRARSRADLGAGRVAIAHRFAFDAVHGIDAAMRVSGMPA